jgi:hypothetical protein
VRGFAVQQQRASPAAERAFVAATEHSSGTTLRLTGKEERGDVDNSDREEAAEK